MAKNVKCIWCMRKMQKHILESLEIAWKCGNCKAIFRIEQLPYYPIEEAQLDA